MLEMLLVLLAVFVTATGLGAARDGSTVENGTWAGLSRSCAKKYFRRRGLVLRAGQLAAIMGDESWAPQPFCGKKSFSSVPRLGRAWTTERRRSLRRNEVATATAKKAVRIVTTTSAAVAAKRQRDLNATAAKVARRAERSSNRAHGKGVWVARLAAESAQWQPTPSCHLRGVPATAGATSQESGWAARVARVRRANDLLVVARETSVSRVHTVADELEAALREQAAATSDFAMARARVTVRWAAADLREELLAA